MKLINGIYDMCKCLNRRDKPNAHWGHNSRNINGADYRYEATLTDNTFKLYHYNTLILTIDLDKDIVELGERAYSRSDTDAINTALYFFNYHVEAGGELNASRANGGLHLEQNGEDIGSEYVPALTRKEVD